MAEIGEIIEKEIVGKSWRNSKALCRRGCIFRTAILMTMCEFSEGFYRRCHYTSVFYGSWRGWFSLLSFVLSASLYFLLFFHLSFRLQRTLYPNVTKIWKKDRVWFVRSSKDIEMKSDSSEDEAQFIERRRKEREALVKKLARTSSRETKQEVLPPESRLVPKAEEGEAGFSKLPFNKKTVGLFLSQYHKT